MRQIETKAKDGYQTSVSTTSPIGNGSTALSSVYHQLIQNNLWEAYRSIFADALLQQSKQRKVFAEIIEALEQNSAINSPPWWVRQNWLANELRLIRERFQQIGVQGSGFIKTLTQDFHAVQVATANPVFGSAGLETTELYLFYITQLEIILADFNRTIIKPSINWENRWKRQITFRHLPQANEMLRCCRELSLINRRLTRFYAAFSTLISRFSSKITLLS